MEKGGEKGVPECGGGGGGRGGGGRRGQNRCTANPNSRSPPRVIRTLKRRPPKTSFCAYLFFRCEGAERPLRELFFDLLSEYKQVDALGVCKATVAGKDGSRVEEHDELYARRDDRFGDGYNDRAVQKYESYKFVVAFENVRKPGYVTEKIANAMLAGAIPIYLGDPDIASIFNERSFINCGKYPHLKDCVARVMEVDGDDRL